MLKFLLAVTLVVLISTLAHSQGTNVVKKTAAARAAVAKLGTGPNARVTVTRIGKPKVKGYINEIREDDFDVITSDNLRVINISYDEVLKIKVKSTDWGDAGAKASWFGLKALKLMLLILKDACLGPISRCSP